MSAPQAYGEHARNLRLGKWQCVSGAIRSQFDQRCRWLFVSNDGNGRYLAREAGTGREGWLTGAQVISDKYLDALLYTSVGGVGQFVTIRNLMATQADSVSPVASIGANVAGAMVDANPVKREGDIARAMSQEESGLRAAFGTGGIVHEIGSAIASAFGAGSLAKSLGELETKALDDRYGKRA